MISTSLLQNLLQEIKIKRPDVCFRFRIIGEMWYPNFMRVLAVTGKGLVLLDEKKSEFVNIPDLSSVMQFEIDTRFKEFQPHFHYEVKPSDFSPAKDVDSYL